MKQRQSNIELLRLLSMFFVLILHADFLTLGAPNIGDNISRPIGALTQYAFESLAICCVDVFVIISGWFGIRFSFHKLEEFLFQVAFFSIGLFLLAAFFNPQKAFSIEGIKSVFLFNESDYWFIKAYLLLMILAPILNAFCDNAPHREFKIILLSYLAIMFVYGWLEPASISFTMNGTTTLSFIGLYLVGRYMRIYRPNFTTYRKETDGMIYLSICILMTLVCWVLLSIGIRISLASRLFNYGCPLVIACAVSLFLFFSKCTFYNKFVNASTKSCLAIYLLHHNIFVLPYYKQFVAKANEIGGIIMIIVFLLIISLFSILIDRVRIFLWNKSCRFFNLAE